MTVASDGTAQTPARPGRGVASHSHRALLVPMLMAVFATDALTGLVVIAYGNNYLINVLKAPAAYPAFALGLYGFVKLLTAPIGGRLLDILPLRPIVAAAAAFQLGGLGIMLVVHSASGFLIGVAVLSVGIAVGWLALFHRVGTGSDASERGTATSYMSIVSIAGTGFGFGAAAVVGETSYWQAAFLLGIALAVAACISLARIPLRQFIAHPTGSGPTVVPVAAPDRMLQLLAAGIIFLHFGVISATLGAFGPFALRTLDRTLLETGFLVAPAGLAGGGAMLLAGRLSKPGSRLRELATLYACFGAAAVAMATIHGPIAFLLIAIPLAGGLGGIQPLLNASLMDVAGHHESSGTTLGWLFFAEGLGSVIGPLLVGATVELGGVREAIAGIGIAGLLLAGTAGVLARRYRL